MTELFINTYLDLYTELLIVNSLSELRFRYSGNGYYKRSNGDSIKINTTEGLTEGLISLSSEERDPLNFGALPFDISLVEGIRLPTVSKNTILLYPSPFAGGAIDGHTPSCYKYSIRNSSTIYSVPISTLSLYSQEQVTAILERWVVQSLNNSYPQRITKVSSKMQEFISSIHYSRSISISNNDAMVIGQQIEDFSEKWFAYHNSQFTHKDNTPREEVMAEKFDSAFLLIEKIKECPVCGEISTRFESSDMGTFRCSCCKCGSTWSKDMTGSSIKLKDKPNETFREYGRYCITTIV